MASPQAHLLPLRGLGRGFYEYDFRIDDAFFADFPESPVQRAAVTVHLTLDKQPRQMTLDFHVKGTIGTDCDRCLAAIDLPVEDLRQLVVKFTDDERADEGDVVFLHPETNDFDLVPYLYESVLLAVPIIRTYDCREGQAPYPCDEDMLDRIEASIEGSDAPAASEPKDDDDKPGPWDVLKGLK